MYRYLLMNWDFRRLAFLAGYLENGLAVHLVITLRGGDTRIEVSES